jgi:hypothetical protein
METLIAILIALATPAPTAASVPPPGRSGN